MAAPKFIHQFVPGPSARTLLLLHGTGGNEHDLLPLGRELDPAAALLSPRGAVSENGRPRFFRRLAEGVFDEADLVQRARDLAGFIAWAAPHYGFAPEKLIAVGYSNGANIASALLLLHPGAIPGAALLRAMVPLVPPDLPDLKSAPVLIVNGEHDPIVPLENAQRLAALLERAGAEVTLDFENAGHQLTGATLGRVREWLGASAGS